MIEGGWTWLSWLVRRIDKDSKRLRREVPWNTQTPYYLRERMRSSVQLPDAAPNPMHMLMLMDQPGSDDPSLSKVPVRAGRV